MGPIVALVASALVAGVAAWAAMLAWPRSELGGAVRLEHTAERALADSPRWRRALRARVDPATATGLALTVAFALLVLGAAVGGVVLAMVRSNTGLERWDMRLARWGAANASPAATDVLRAVTQLGGAPVVFAVGLAVAAVELRRGRRRAVVGFLLVALIGEKIVVNLIKWGVDRARPDVGRLAGFSGPSFPSGHAAAAATTYAAVALLLGWHRSFRVRALLSGLAAALTAAVATTRVLLGVHWFTDVVAGVAIGWAWFALSAIAFGGRLLRFGAPVEVAQHAAVTPPAGVDALDERAPSPP